MEKAAMCRAIIGSGFHNLYDLEDVYQGMYTFGRKIPTMTIPKNMSSAPATRIAMHFGLKGIVSSLSTVQLKTFDEVVGLVYTKLLNLPD